MRYVMTLRRVALLFTAVGALSAAHAVSAQEAPAPAEPATAPEQAAVEAPLAAPTPSETPVAAPEAQVAEAAPVDPAQEMQTASAAGVVFAKIKAPSILELKGKELEAARGLSCDSRLATLLDNPQARDVLARHIPDVVSDKRIAMARNMTLKQLAKFGQTGITREQLAEIDVDLATATTARR